MAWRRPDDAELEPPLRDEVDHVQRVVDGERDRHVRVLALELAEQERKDGGAGAGRAADLEPTAELVALAGDLLQQLLLERQHPLSASVQPLAGLGRLDPPPGAVEEPLAEPLLERTDLETHRRLGDAELLGREREALPVDDGAEGRELTSVHKSA